MKKLLSNPLKKLSLLLLIPGILLSGEIGFGSGRQHKFSSLKRSKVSIVKVENNKYRLELAKIEEKDEDLLLDFENKKSSDLKDKSGNYSIKFSQYSVLEDKAPAGKRYAAFTTRNSQIKINARGKGVLGEKVISSPFYVGFFIMPGELEQNSKIFYKTYITGSKKYGIECIIENNRLAVRFHNMFFYKVGETKTYTLKSPEKLQSNEWTHVVISVNPNLGKAELFENGIEKDSFLATYSESDSTSLLVGFHEYDTNPLVIGKDFYGKLDHFMLGRGEVEDVSQLIYPFAAVKYDERVKFPSHLRGYAVSKVIKTKYSNSIPFDLKFDSETPNGTSLEVLYRFSDEPFEEDSQTPKWNHYNKKTFKENLKKLHISKKEDPDRKAKSNLNFQYFQWKVNMRSDYSGNLTPSLTSLDFKYLESVPPAKPYNIRVSSYDHENLKVCLMWNSNHERDVIKGGGYMIHYGLSPNRMLGTLRLNPDNSKITGTQKKGEGSYKALEQCIDNTLINFNANLHKDKNLLTFRNGITYYFKVSAYNDKYPILEESAELDYRVGLDQKSPPSDPVLFTFKTKIEEGD
ncbi:MAG: hypothetical protein KDK36_15915 [Leptospiraceae bacterium]|nr:hypothetical protein [Leptospiraceae bacterium]